MLALAVVADEVFLWQVLWVLLGFAVCASGGGGGSDAGSGGE